MLCARVYPCGALCGRKFGICAALAFRGCPPRAESRRAVFLITGVPSGEGGTRAWPDWRKTSLVKKRAIDIPF